MKSSHGLSSALWAFLLITLSSVAFSEEEKSPPVAGPPTATVEAQPTVSPPAQPPAEAAPAPAPKCECPACPAEASKDPSLLGCVKALETVAVGLKEAYLGFRQWTAETSRQMEGLEKRDTELQSKLVDADTQIAKLRAESEKTNKRKIKELTQESKQLTKDLAVLRKEKAATCDSISKTAGRKVKEIQADLKIRLDQAQSEVKQ